jgi:hypothetical protein
MKAVDAKRELADNRAMSVADQARYPGSGLCRFLDSRLPQRGGGGGLVPAAPWCPRNERYAASVRQAFTTGSSPHDFSAEHYEREWPDASAPSTSTAPAGVVSAPPERTGPPEYSAAVASVLLCAGRAMSAQPWSSLARGSLDVRLVVAEALRKLASEGLVTIVPNGGHSERRTSGTRHDAPPWTGSDAGR